VRVTIVAPGSRGDIQPYLALAVGLIQALNVPLTPTGAFSSALAPGLSFGPRGRRLGHWITRQAWARRRSRAPS
jgi:hypothetical protein